MIAGMFEKPPADIKEFFGLNNVSDSLRLGLGWLAQAENVNVTDTGALEVRGGYSLNKAGSYSAAYGTIDFQKLFLVEGLALKTYEGATLCALSSTAPMHWAEINGDVYFSNGLDAGVIKPDNSVSGWRWDVPYPPTVTAVTGSIAPGLYAVCCTYLLPDGRETGASDPVIITVLDGQAISIGGIPQVSGAKTRVYISPANSDVFQLAATTTGTAIVWNFTNDALGVDLKTDGMDPLPLGVSCIQFFRGKLYAAQYMPQADQTVVWFSQPLGFHLFALDTDYHMVPGEVTMLAPADSGLVVGTRERVYALADGKLAKVADYGVVPGQHWSKDDDKRILFWSTRGVCSALPFSNLTDKAVSVAPGIKAGGAIVQRGGQKRYVASIQQGGVAFNQHP